MKPIWQIPLWSTNFSFWVNTWTCVYYPSFSPTTFPTLILMETIFPSRFSRTERWRPAHTRQSTVIRPWKHQRCHEQSRFHRPDIPGCQLVCFPLPSRLPGAEAVNATLPGWAGTQQHKSWSACAYSQSHQVDGQGGDPATAQQAERSGVPDCLQHGVHGENVILLTSDFIMIYCNIKGLYRDTKMNWAENSEGSVPKPRELPI